MLADLPKGYWRFGETSGAALNEVGSSSVALSGTYTQGVTGALTGDKKLKREGMADQAVGKIKRGRPSIPPEVLSRAAC